MRKVKSLLALFMAIIMVLTMGACGKKAADDKDATATTAEPTVRSVVDMGGTTVEFPAKDVKVMTCNTVATMTVLMLGGTDAVATLGQGFDYSEGSLNRSMFKGLENLPTVTRDNANAEEIAKINPTVVIMDVPKIVETLRTANIPTVQLGVTDPASLIKSVTIMGDILGGDAAKEAKAYADYYQGLIDDVQAKTKDISDADKPVVYYGRVEGGSAGLKSIPDFWISACGGVNLASKLGIEGSRASVTDEQLIKENPDIIIAETPALYNTFKTSKKYASLNAVKEGRVYCNPMGWGMGSVDGALELVWAPTVIQPG